MTKNICHEQGMTLIITLLMMIVLLLAGLSVARLSSVALRASGDLAQEQMLTASNDQALASIKQTLAAVQGSISLTSTSQPWYNIGTTTPNASFWQGCQPVGNTPNSCATLSPITIGTQQIIVQYFVRATPYVQQMNTVLGQGQQLTGNYYQIFTHATAQDGTVSNTEAWLLKP